MFTWCPHPDFCLLSVSGRGPSAHHDSGHRDRPGAGGADRWRDLPVPSENSWIPRFLRRSSLQPHQLQQCRTGREKHPGVRHGAERAGGVADRPQTDRQTDPVIQTRLDEADIYVQTQKNVVAFVCCFFETKKKKKGEF